jgi:hypothetical protein
MLNYITISKTQVKNNRNFIHFLLALWQVANANLTVGVRRQNYQNKQNLNRPQY